MLNRIKYFRALKSLTQQELADLVQVNRLTITSIEVNRYAPSLELAQRIARVFNRKVDDIFPMEDDDINSPGINTDLQ